MGLKDRISRAEERAGLHEPLACEACGGFVVTEIVRRDGRREFPHGPPCSLCDSQGADGRIGRIVYYEPEKS